MFDYEPVFRNFVFGFGQFFVRADSAFTSTSVEFANGRRFESSSLSGVKGG